MKSGVCSACNRVSVARLVFIIALASITLPAVEAGQADGDKVAPATESKEQNDKRQLATDESLYCQAISITTCFKNLGTLDFGALLDVFATPNARKSWNESAAGVFSEQIDAAAFLDTALVFPQKNGEGSFTVVAYNVWIDSAILATCERKDGGLKITELRTVSAGVPSVPDIQNPLQLEKELNRRLLRAAEIDYTTLASSPENSKAIQKTLSDYRKSMREALSPEAKKENEGIRKAVAELMAQCGKPTPDTKALTGLPQEWRALLHPVYLSKSADESSLSATGSAESGVGQEAGAKSARCLLVLSASNRPGRWLFVELQASGQTATVKSVSIGSVKSAPKGSSK